MNKTIVIGLMLCGVFFSVHAQDNQMKIYDAFIKGEMERWRAIMTDIESRKSPSVADKIELISYYYGYIGYCLGIKAKQRAEIYIEKGDDLLSELEEKNPINADVYALKAAFIGFKIGVSPYKAPFIGVSSMKNAKKALSVDKNNIRANIEQGNILYYAPSAFGGNKEEAKNYYRKAISLFEKSPEKMAQNWLYLSLLTQLGQMQTSEGKYAEAKKTYEKILQVEPHYKYVKNELLPALEKRQ